MGFERFGKYGYVSQAKVVPFVKYLEEGKIEGTKCHNCHSVYFPPRADCLKCGYNRMTWVPVGNKCSLVSYTEVHFGPPQFQKETPYLLGLAEMEGGQRVFAPISNDVSKETLRPGLRLKLTPLKAGDSVFYTLEK